jgi:hypothetical protein
MMRCNDKPMHVRFTLPESTTSPQNWRFSGEVKGENVAVRDLQLKTLESQVAVTAKHVALTGLKGTTSKDETFALDLALGLSPFSVTVTDGELRGDPAIIETFIEGRRPQRTYRRIWQDFAWDAEHPPLFRVPSLRYRHDSRSGEWRLDMQGTADCEEVGVRDLEAKRLTLSVKLDLPGRVVVKDIVLTTDEATVEGEVEVSTDGVPSCDFRISAEDGGCDPRVVIRMIHPNLEAHLDSMQFAKDSLVTCEGSFFLAKDPRLNLAGSLRAPSWRWGKVVLSDVVAKWGVRDSEVRWDVTKATCCEGTVASTGVYDTVTRRGDIAIDAKDASLTAVMKQFQLGEPKPEHEAKLGVAGRVGFLRDWAGHPLQLTGTGQVNIREGDLWRVPILSQLGLLLDVPLLDKIFRGKASGLGRISALRADLMFDGERISVPNLVTDGTVISLSGSGEYSWDTERIEFEVVGETFRKLPVVSFFSKTFSWVFNARLTGTRSDYKWRLNNMLRRALTGEDSSGSLRLDNP